MYNISLKNVVWPAFLFSSFARVFKLAELNTTNKEMKEFFGVSIIMKNFPRIFMYWGVSAEVPLVADTSNVNGYFRLSSNLHFASQYNHMK